MTDFEIQKTAKAVVDMLLNDDRFISRMEKLANRRGSRMLKSSQAAELLGVSRKTICMIAEEIGGIRGDGNSAHWMFEEAGLKERYTEYKTRKKN